ncbi:MAG: type I glyceraldehyde-3-phosphate dehydrogenase [Patescibacteria group bacterium]|nr:type I glyceraldehyde-3-phosphate dehydrogenase [Patescibacteria group bacterium]
MMNIAINGFGRIGRAVFKILLEKRLKDLKIVAINDLTDTETLAHLLKYDSVYGKFNKKIRTKKDRIIVLNKPYKILSERNPRHLPWQGLKVDLVLECTGLFRTRKEAMAHVWAGAKKVLISAPAKSDGIKTIVLGVNEQKLRKTDKIISNASCTTNCLAPVTDCIRQNFGIKKALMTTIHSYTADQRLLDAPHFDLRRARSAAVNIVPTTTGAAIATTKTIPSLKNKFDGMAVRVPTPNGSLCDIVFVTTRKITEKKLTQSLKRAARSARLKNIITVSEGSLVSSDIIGNPASAIVDLPLTKIVGSDLLKLIVWYDNEWGYSNRMVDLVEYLKKKRMV